MFLIDAAWPEYWPYPGGIGSKEPHIFKMWLIEGTDGNGWTGCLKVRSNLNLKAPKV